MAFALASGQAIGESLAMNPLHHQVIDVPVRSDLVQSTDVRMIEPGGHLRFVQEAFTAAAGGRRLRIEDLDRDLAPEPWVVGEVDLAHTTPSKSRDNDVRTDTRTRGQRQERHYSGDAPSGIPTATSFTSTIRTSPLSRPPDCASRSPSRRTDRGAQVGRYRHSP